MVMPQEYHSRRKSEKSAVEYLKKIFSDHIQLHDLWETPPTQVRNLITSLNFYFFKRSAHVTALSLLLQFYFDVCNLCSCFLREK